jgi:hypothetical protein
LVPLVVLLTWDCYSSPVAITFFSHTAIITLAPRTWLSGPGFQDSNRQNWHGRINMAETVNGSKRPIRDRDRVQFCRGTSLDGWTDATSDFIYMMWLQMCIQWEHCCLGFQICVFVYVMHCDSWKLAICVCFCKLDIRTWREHVRE